MPQRRNRKRGICVKCHSRRTLTKHHILPRRHYYGEGDIILICRKCHDKLERAIVKAERLTREEYRRILRKFLK